MNKKLENKIYAIVDNRHNIVDFNKDKYTKFLVTIALRLGVAIEDDGKDIALQFSGEHSEYNRYHESDNYIGALTVNSQPAIENVKICTHKNGSSIATLWPMHDDNDKQQQSKDSKTSAFIEYYINGSRLFTIEDIANYYHPIFLESPGLSPVALEKEVCARKEEALRELYARETSRLVDKNKTLKETLDSQIAQNTKENNSKLQTKVTELIETARPGEAITRRPRKILMNVDLQEMHTKNRGLVQGVVLYFDDGTSVRNNWSGAEKRKSIIDKLVGREVVTDVWGNYPSDQWFANVYLK